MMRVCTVFATDARVALAKTRRRDARRLKSSAAQTTQSFARYDVRFDGANAL
jgi:hypothetical protein